MALRLHAGETVYTGSFISHLLETILYYRAPMWVFAVCYTLFGAIVVASWIWARPRPFTKNSSDYKQKQALMVLFYMLRRASLSLKGHMVLKMSDAKEIH